MTETAVPRMDSSSTMAATHDAFISYASADSALAQDVVAHLEGEGLSCWIAPRDVEPGTAYADSIIRAINGTRTLVLLLSQNSVASSHVSKEVERVSSKRRPIIALRVDATQLTPALEYFLSESQWIDVGPSGMSTVATPLSKAVRRLAAGSGAVGSTPMAGEERSQISTGLPAMRQQGRKSRLLLLLMVAAVVLAAGLAWFLS